MRWIYMVLLTALTVGCGNGETTAPTGTDANDAVGDTAGAASPDCSAAAMAPSVSAALSPDGSIPGTVIVQQCQGGYARVFYEPDAANLESEQVFLVDTGGDWVVLTSGTGIDCATETDWQPPQLEDACVALGLR